MTIKTIILTLTVFGLLIGNFSFAQMTQETKSTKENGDITYKMPKVVFLEPKEGEILKSTIKVLVEVSNVSSVEFYLRRLESLIEIYLGRADKNGDIWEYSWDTTQTPNGDYYLFSKITTVYGEYSDLGIKITIYNETERSTEEEEKLITEVQIIQEDIQKEEEMITQTTSDTEQQIQESMESLVQETKEVLEEPEKQTVEPYVSEQLEQSSTEISENIEQLTEKIKEKATASPEELEKIEEEKEQIKQETIQKIIEPLILIEQIAREETKVEIEQKKKETEKEIKSLLEEMEKEILERERKKLEKLQEILKDSDQDGLPDHEEVRLRTNAFNPDTDGDGFLDGQEIALGFDPLKPSPADKIVYQDPRKVEPKEAEIYKVERVEIITLLSGELGIKLEGKGRPNSFITLYIYSSFLVLTTKTDENGHWEYVLDKPLEEGEHEVYVAVTNNHGEITAKSEAFRFIKTPTAVAAIKPLAKGEKVVSPSEAFQKSALLLLVAIVILAIGIALIIIGILVQKGKKEIKSEI